MRSTIKFPDRWIKEVQYVRFGHDFGFRVWEIPFKDSIPPFQGLNGSCCSHSHWTMSNAEMFCAYSACTDIDVSEIKLTGTTLKHFFASNKMIIPVLRPVRAIYYKTGQRTVYQTLNDNKPCKGEIL